MLAVKYSDSVRRRQERGRRHHLPPTLPAGWFVWVKTRNYKRATDRWEAVEQLRFARQIDAQRAASALTAAGLDTQAAMQRVGGFTVLQTAFEALQW